MTRLLRFLTVGACCAVILAPLALLGGAPAQGAASTDGQRPELAYLKQVNRWRPPSDPQLLFLLMAQFANAGRHAEGIDYFNSVLKRFEAELDDTHKALYLTAVASLRAGHANDVFLLGRIGWVRDTLKLLDEAKRLSHSVRNTGRPSRIRCEKSSAGPPPAPAH